MFPFTGFVPLSLFWLLVCGQDQIELQFTSISTQTDLGTKENINLVTNAVSQLVRPESDKYPYVVLEDQDKQNGYLKLIYPDIKRGSPKIQIRIKISKADLKNQITVFPAGARGFGFPVKQSFVVLRQSASNKTMHYLNLAYIRRTGKQIIVEWSTIDPKNFGKNRLDFEICRGEECDMAHWVFGTCPVVSNKCPLPIPHHGNVTLLNKWTWIGDDVSGNDSTPDVSTSTSTNQLQNLNLNNLHPIASSQFSQSSYRQNNQIRPSFAPNKFSGPMSPSQDFKQYGSQSFPSSQSGQNFPQRQKRGESAEKSTKTSEKSEEKDEGPEIPNSLDLLMLKRSDEKSGPGAVEGDHFPNTLSSKRQVEDLQNEDLECFECEKMGEFFDDFEEEPEFAQLVGEHTRQQQSQRKGDTNSGDSVATDLLKLYPTVPYIGYGNCNFTVEDVLKPKSKEMDDLIEFLLASLRLTCDWNSESRMRNIFRSKMKLIEVQDDFTANISPHSPITKYKIVTQNEFTSLMTAIILSKYIQLYRQDEASIIDQSLNAASQQNSSEAPLPTPIENGSSILDQPLNSPQQTNVLAIQDSDVSREPAETAGNDIHISKRMHFLSRLVLGVTETLNKRFSQHFIKGLRMLLRFLKDKFLSLLQESLSPPNAGGEGHEEVTTADGQPEVDENRHDQNHVMGLKEFILYGLGPLAKSGTSCEASFRSFESVNQKRINALVQAYHPLPPSSTPSS